MLKSSHVLCKVKDLAASVDQWRHAGFTVQWGSDPNHAINAIVWFDKGPFIELIDVKGAQPPQAYRAQLPAGMLARFDRWLAAPEGWCDLCLESDGDITPHLPTLEAAGIEAVGPIVGHRTPPDGKAIRTQTCFPTDPALPFFMGAYVPDARPRRVSHPNGATSIAAIQLTAPNDRDRQYAALLGHSDPWLQRTQGEYGVHVVSVYGLRDPIPTEQAAYVPITQVSPR
ncbi:MAG: VOC family protein [Pseudomonadota bacterium]